MSLLRRFDEDGNRWLLWPIRLRWVRPLCETSGPWTGAPRLFRGWFVTHGWSVGDERVPVAKTAHGMMPGWRKLYGQTLHLGRLKICFGDARR